MNKFFKLMNVLFVKKQLPWRFKHMIQPFVSWTHVRLYKDRYLNFKTLKVSRLSPDLVIIGAQKAGTSSLHAYINDHPDIFMSHVKEPGLFLDDNEAAINHRVGTPDQVLKIMLYGYRGEKIFGESSTYYSKAPAGGVNSPQNMFDRNPKVKLIYILRDPIGRIVSQYLHYIDTGRLDCSFEEFLLTEKTHLSRSLYFYQISRYLKLFKSDQIKLILFEELISDTPKVLKEVCEFLSVDSSFSFPPAEVKNRSRSRSKIDKSKLKISEPIFDSMMREILPDKLEVEKILGRTINCWNLSKENWC